MGRKLILEYRGVDLHSRTSPEQQAQRRCIPGHSEVACSQSPHRSFHLPGWTVWAGLWSKRRYRLWVLPASGNEGPCSFGLSPSAATVRSEKQTVDNTQAHVPVHTWKQIHTNQISLSRFFFFFFFFPPDRWAENADCKKKKKRPEHYKKRSMTYFVFFWTTKDCQIKRLCGFPAYKTAEDYPTASNSKKDTKLIHNLHSSIILLLLIASERFFDEICRQIEEKSFLCLTTSVMRF